jgi:hypothetical protein
MLHSGFLRGQNFIDPADLFPLRIDHGPSNNLTDIRHLFLLSKINKGSDAGNKIPAGEITSRYLDIYILNAGVGQTTSDLNSMCTGDAETKKSQRSVFCPMLFCATNSGSSKTPLGLRGGTSFELADSSNCIELTFLQ